MGSDLSDPFGSRGALYSSGGGNPAVCRNRALDGASRLCLALVAGRVWFLEQRLQALCALAGKRRLAGVARRVERGFGCRMVDVPVCRSKAPKIRHGGPDLRRDATEGGDAGQHGGPCSCLCSRGKKDEGDQALGRSRGNRCQRVASKNLFSIHIWVRM